MENNKEKFIQQNYPDRDFLQSEEWRKFQESVGRKTFHIEGEGFWANIIEHTLPIVGKYFYIPRGPITSVDTEGISNSKYQISNKFQKPNSQIQKLIDLAKKENVGWIRFDAINNEIINSLRHPMSKYRIVKAPHDMQPKEVFVIDISKSEEELLSVMKPKTRYNIGLAQKKCVSVRITDPYEYKNDLDEFLQLVRITAQRQKVNFHAEDYYRKMFEIIPAENIKLYCAEYENKIIAANIVIFQGPTAIYLHGASDDKYKNLMAPYLLQWKQIQDAKKFRATKYDFGGVKINSKEDNWSGITRFKQSFSPNTKPVEFLGSYDIIINSWKYNLYRFIQKIKNIL